MKFLLAILLSFIMTEAPVLAIHGGYSLNSAISLVGTYAGVMVPTADNILSASATDFGTNSLGLFTLSLPSSGLGSGSVIIFSNGRTFTGDIHALANPDPGANAGIIGILTASFNYNLSIPSTGTDGAVTVSTISVTANAQGSFDVQAVQDANSVGSLGVNVDGTSQINVDQGFVSGSNGTPIVVEQVTFAIEGFQQSQVPTASLLSSGT